MQLVAEGMGLVISPQRPEQGQQFKGGPWCREKQRDGSASSEDCHQMESLMDGDHPGQGLHYMTAPLHFNADLTEFVK